MVIPVYGERTIDIVVPEFPACAEPCGACFDGDDRRTVYVVVIPVSPGDAVAEGQMLAVVETNKTTIEVSAPGAGAVVQVVARPGDQVTEGAILLSLRQKSV